MTGVPSLAGMGSDREPGSLTCDANSLLFVLRARQHGEPSGPGLVSELRGRFGLCEAEAQDTILFAELVSTSPGDLKRCLGVNCTMRGASGFHGELRNLLGLRDSDQAGVALFCLGQCDSGPTLRHGRLVYCGSLQRVSRDDRSWRRGQALGVEFQPPGSGALPV